MTVENQLQALKEEIIEALKAQNCDEINLLRDKKPHIMETETYWLKNLDWPVRFNNFVTSEIITMLKKAQIAPEQAEILTVKVKCDPLLPPFPVEKFDPKTKTYWSLPMVAAWVMWRDINKVRDHWGKYLYECEVWGQMEAVSYGEVVGTSYHRYQLEPKNIFQTFEAARKLKFLHGEVFVVEPDEAREALLNKFQLGNLIAYGDKQEYEHSGYSVEPTDKGRVEITSTEWRDDYFSDHNGDYTDIGSGAGAIYRNSRYKNVEIEREKVLELWPVNCEGEQIEQVTKLINNVTKSFTRNEIHTAYKNYVIECESKKEIPNPPTREKFMKDNYGIGRTRARELHEQFSPVEWKKVGRRPSKLRRLITPKSETAQFAYLDGAILACH